jgi:hypothetical protein
MAIGVTAGAADDGKQQGKGASNQRQPLFAYQSRSASGVATCGGMAELMARSWA